MRLIVAITGASGIIYSKRLLEILNKKRIETHLIISRAAETVLQHELDTTQEALTKLASYTHDINDWTAPIVSGSFRTDGMIIIPCSMKTLAGIAHGYADNVILRAADVTLKEKRKFIVVPRETPLHAIHLDNMLNLAEHGALIVPAMPAYYHKPKRVDDLVDFIVGRVLDLLDIDHSLYKRWKQI